MTDYPQTAEYGQVQQNHWPISTPKVIAMERGWTFAHIPEGYEPAGSARR